MDALLAGYASDASESGDEAPLPVVLPQLPPEASEDESQPSEAGEEEHDEEEGAGGAAAPPVPVALLQAADESEEEEEEAPGVPEEQPTLALPPPDFGSWAGEPGGVEPARQTAPKVTALGKKKRGEGGPSQISAGFTSTLSRHDQLQRQRLKEWDEQQEERGRNNGFSSAYDSVFHGPAADEETARRTKVNSKGVVKTLSKKEAARMDALEASLRD